MFIFFSFLQNVQYKNICQIICPAEQTPFVWKGSFSSSKEATDSQESMFSRVPDLTHYLIWFTLLLEENSNKYITLQVVKVLFKMDELHYDKQSNASHITEKPFFKQLLWMSYIMINRCQGCCMVAKLNLSVYRSCAIVYMSKWRIP